MRLELFSSSLTYELLRLELKLAQLEPIIILSFEAQAAQLS
jgi:hypothetical protein